MTPGTTPTHYFHLPQGIEAKKLRITYEQGGKIVLQKETKDCAIKENSVEVKLSQADTLRFDSNTVVRIQLKLLTTGGDALVSNLIKKTTNIVLDKGEI